MTLADVLTWDGLRYTNAVLALTVVLLLSMGARIRWSTTPVRIRRMVPWVILTYVLIAYGSVEVALQERQVDPGLRVMLLTLNLTGFIIALLYGMGDRHHRPATPRRHRKHWWVWE